MATECHLSRHGVIRHVISSEALGLEEHIAFCAHIHSLIIDFPHFVAHLAVPRSVLSLLVEFSERYPMVIPVNTWCIYVGR